MTIKSMPPEITEPYYFGCWEECGHYTFHPTMRSAKWCPAVEWLMNHDGQLPPQDVSTQGLVQFRTWPGACTVAFWDYSVDSRGNSSSSFLLPRELGPEEALEAAREAFPAVFKRFTFKVVLPHPG